MTDSKWDALFDYLDKWMAKLEIVQQANKDMDKPKGTCGKCGGSGNYLVRVAIDAPINPDDYNCTQCDGTGRERRIREKRRKSEGHRNYDRTAGMLIKDVGTFWVSRRRVPDRRKC